MKIIGDQSGYAAPETYLVALDDNESAELAVRTFLEFTPHDDRVIQVAARHLSHGAMAARNMNAGSVILSH